ncbi:hypothetical protein [Streptomyces phaeochromogenes]
MIRPMLVRRGRSRPEKHRRHGELRDQYKKQIGPLRLYLLLECAPLVVNPIEVADAAFKHVFAQPERDFTYGEVRKIAEGIVRELKVAGKLHTAAEYSLEKIFDSYLTPDLTPVRETLRALDALCLAERRVIEAEMLHLLTTDGLAETVGGKASTKRVQRKNALAKLAEAEADLELLEPFFAGMRGHCSDN